MFTLILGMLLRTFGNVITNCLGVLLLIFGSRREVLRRDGPGEVFFCSAMVVAVVCKQRICGRF